MSGCLFEDVPTYKYRTTWVCTMDDCGRATAVVEYDQAKLRAGELELTSTVDEALFTDGIVGRSGTVPSQCRLVFGLNLFGHELEPSMLCFLPSGFELTVSIPDENAETSSTWLLMAREL
ncbi:hypothetical protein Hoch_2118 [Haliangium ochraceum DSM 14365]|uniref:Lipoprotein n=1 Tax=Haliangium ochraceum (strain DSM 14365 / JCM 11303 / SMP-2) TaxID=502025 RepID=D0LGU1_HALO1|nr:hypothetical protein Hoch_2118 [Haliangium ochraceum DSM 14365]